MTVHGVSENMADESELFIFGDDFDAILDALEDDDAIQEDFNDAVVQVRIFALFIHFAVIFQDVDGRIVESHWSSGVE